MVLDLRDPNGTGGFKRLNAPGGSAFKDGPIRDALFNLPMLLANLGRQALKMGGLRNHFLINLGVLQ